MPTHNLSFWDDCPSLGASTDVTITVPEAFFQVYVTSCTAQHVTHLEYVDPSSNAHFKVHETDFKIDGPTLTLRFGWQQAGEEEDIEHAGPHNIQPVSNPIKNETSYTIPVPAPQADADVWNFDGKAPGFHLTVKVKRK